MNMILYINKKLLALTNCKLHCGCSGVRCLCSFLDRHVLSDTDALRNPQRQLASDRYAQAKKKDPTATK